MEVGRKTCKRCEVQVHTESEEDLKKGHVAKKARRRTEDDYRRTGDWPPRRPAIWPGGPVLAAETTGRTTTDDYRRTGHWQPRRPAIWPGGPVLAAETDSNTVCTLCLCNVMRIVDLNADL